MMKKLERRESRKKKLSEEDEQKEWEVKSDSDLMKGTEKTHLTASSVRLVFICGIAYLLMTVWKTDVESISRPSEEGDGELLDIP